MSRNNGLSDTKEMPAQKGRGDPRRGTAPTPPPPARYLEPGQNPQTRRPPRSYDDQDNEGRPVVQRASMRDPAPTPGYDYESPPPPRKNSAPAPQKKRKKKRRKKHVSPVKRIFTALLTLVIVLFGIYSGTVLLAAHQINREETGTRSLNPGAAEKDRKVRNILLIGTDSRGSDRGRADTIMLLSFSSRNKTLTLTSLLRDSYASIPGHGTDKLNAAYAYGGPTLLMDTVCNNFGIAVDDYITVNFKGFAALADALGGVTATLSESEARELNNILISEVNALMGDAADSDLLPGAGTYTLNGKQTLSFARIRHVGNADFERTRRQRFVMTSLMASAKKFSPRALSDILTEVLPKMTTNLSAPDIYGLSLTVPVKMLMYDTRQMRLPADGTFSDQTAQDGQMVLAVDYDANLQLFKEAVTDPVEKLPMEEGKIPD